MKLSSCAIAAVFVAGAFAAPAKPVSRLEDRSLETVSHVKNPTPPDPFKGTPARSVPNEESGLVERAPAKVNQDAAPVQHPRPIPGEDGSGFKPAGSKPRDIRNKTKAPIFTGDPAIKRAPKDVKNKTKVPIFTGDPAFTG